MSKNSSKNNIGNQLTIDNIVKNSVINAMKSKGLIKEDAQEKSSIKSSSSKTNKLFEALINIPKSFVLKTEKLSSKTKEAHERLYKKYIDSFNKVSSAQDAVNFESSNSNFSQFRSLKEDEVYNMNAIKLHELYFSNISDLASEISIDSIPYIKLARSFGSFDRWQYDFIACCMASREGWAITYYDPYNNCYCNAVINEHSDNIPLGGIPIIVMDMWSHSYYRDYLDDKKSYVLNMMRELNWNVIEARMTVAEQSVIHNLYKIAPMVNNTSEVMLNQAAVEASQTPVEPVDPHRGMIDQTEDRKMRQMSPLDNASLPASTQISRSRFQG